MHVNDYSICLFLTLILLWQRWTGAQGSSIVNAVGKLTACVYVIILASRTGSTVDAARWTPLC